MPQLLRLPAGRRAAFRLLSQISIDYRSSALSEGRAGNVRGGDRLPWVHDNYTVLETMAWQAHVYGVASPGVRSACEQRGLALHQFPWTTAAKAAGFQRNAVYVVRPDGYVGLATHPAGGDALKAYVPSYDLSSPA